MDHQTPEEREVRLKKADSIRRMLADQGHHGEPGGAASGSGGASSLDSSEAKQQLDEEKKHRERLLALNQVIAQQVLEKSRMVAGKFTFVGSFHSSCLIIILVFFVQFIFVNWFNFRFQAKTSSSRPVERSFISLILFEFLCTHLAHLSQVCFSSKFQLLVSVFLR